MPRSQSKLADEPKIHAAMIRSTRTIRITAFMGNTLDTVPRPFLAATRFIAATRSDIDVAVARCRHGIGLLGLIPPWESA